MKLALKVYMMREDMGMNFVDIARKIGDGMSGQEAARLWLKVKDAREAYNNREKVVYRKRINVKKPKKVVDIKEKASKMDSQMALAFRQAFDKQ